VSKTTKTKRKSISDVLTKEAFEADAMVDELSIVRDEAIHTVLTACIHNLSDAINELAQANDAYFQAMENALDDKVIEIAEPMNRLALRRRLEAQ
jgi:hypothetical protein